MYVYNFLVCLKAWHLPSVHINEHHMLYHFQMERCCLAYCEYQPWVKKPLIKWFKNLKYWKNYKIYNFFWRKNKKRWNKQTNKKTRLICKNREDEKKKKNKKKLPLWKLEILRNKRISSYMIYMKYFQQNI